ncbi:P-loop containing nucleoside triphosphate hydrolase protein [Mycena vulgaris]|nr:P-loop containing nucleoside triphosphate hydrolase protein [Mycena vulgaris]
MRNFWLTQIRILGTHCHTTSLPSTMSLEGRTPSKRTRDAAEPSSVEGTLEPGEFNLRSRKRKELDPTGNAERDANSLPMKTPGQEIRAVSALRERSRQEYLKKRELQQIELLRADIADDEALFHGTKLTKEETSVHERKKDLLAVVDARLAVDDGDRYYRIPEEHLPKHGDKQGPAHWRHEDSKPKEDEFVTDVDHWEAAQARSSAGLRGRTEDRDEYEYVFDERQAIDFVEGYVMNDGQQSGAVDRLLQARIHAAEERVKSLDARRKSLPIYAYRENLLEAIQDHQILIVVAETGSGKTTQLPQYLHEAGYTVHGQKIGCTQPRRVAAMSVAARVAEEMRCKIGDEVGYSIRFEDCTNHKTVLKYMTDGMLLREFLTSSDLANYSVLIIDEAHERTLNTDILFALDVARARPELRVLISSATLDAQKSSAYFDGSSIFYVPGRVHPVEIYYTPQPEANYLHAAITTCFQIHTTQPRGDILVFLTGQDEIEAAHENIQETARVLGGKIPELIICPIYTNLPSNLQAKIFEPTPEGAMKVILATNIAETSITIDGVVFVIDPGFVKQNSYNPRTGMSSLVIVPCSQASANQRAGRAGRVGPGKTFRLYTKWAFANELEASTVPEIQRTNLALTVLNLKCLGIDDPVGFDFMDPPPVETLLTKLGRRMAEFPVDPELSKAILTSEQYSCTEEVLTIVSMLSESGSIFYRPKDKKLYADQARKNFFHPAGDHFTLLNLWNQWFVQFKSVNRARDIRDQLVRLCERVGLTIRGNPNPGDTIPVQKALAAGYFYNAATLQRDGKSYRTMKTGHGVHTHPSSSLFQHQPPVRTVLYYELVVTSKSYMRQVMEIKPAWLLEVAPHYFKPEDVEGLDERKKKIPKVVGLVKTTE